LGEPAADARWGELGDVGGGQRDLGAGADADDEPERGQGRQVPGEGAEQGADRQHRESDEKRFAAAEVVGEVAECVGADDIAGEVNGDRQGQLRGG